MSLKSGGGFVTDLRLRGYAVLPEPRQVELDGGELDLALADWDFQFEGVAEDDIAVQMLQAFLVDEFGVPFGLGEETDGAITMAVRPGTVETGTGDGRDEQAYVLDISLDGIALTGNGRPGLFYAVQTLLQLLDHPSGALPTGRIVDWPSYELRLVHWDTKHHRDRMETLKRYLDWSARFKVNGILFELEDKFEYPSHPVIGAPGALTTAELQELTDYALERHIEMVPDVQAPAHLSYVLKHEEFAHLRCDGSNYQICMDEPEARNLLFDMYTDVCNATKGCKYFHVSTDEVYYAGICEKFRKPYNPENRSLTVIDYVNAAHQHLSKLGRRVIIWLEYPMLPEHVKLLPADLLNGIGGRKSAQVAEENKRGIRQFAYSPIQGGELTFPNYFAYMDPSGSRVQGRLQDTCDVPVKGLAMGGHPIGTICAAWDDAGLHNETFWLGWAMMAQASWTPGALDAADAASRFMDIYYGPGQLEMSEVYREIQAEARFMEHTLEKLPSTVRGPSYGHPYWKGEMERTDRTLVPPAPPVMPNDTAVSMIPRFGQRYKAALAAAPARLADNDRLLLRLHQNLPHLLRNGYNLEVFLSLAHYLRHFMEMILAVGDAEELLHRAAVEGKGGGAERAMHHLVGARERLRPVVDDLYVMFGRLTAVWEKARLPKNAPVDGKEFVHVMDDVKDHFADRRVDLSYLIAPEESLGLRDWLAKLDEVIERYGVATGLRAKQADKVPVDEG